MACPVWGLRSTLALIGALSPIIVVGGVVVAGGLIDPSREQSAGGGTSPERRGLSTVDAYNRLADKVSEIAKRTTDWGYSMLSVLTDVALRVPQIPDKCDIRDAVMTAFRAGALLRFLARELSKEDMDALERELRLLFETLANEMEEACTIEKKPKLRLPAV
jgi:hypothetical protein